MIRKIRDCKYVIISPAKDEEKYIESTIESVLKQTVKPSSWIIVDDGSRDKTAQIIGEYCNEYTWIKLLQIKRDVRRNLGIAEIIAFNKGFDLVRNTHFDFIVKLDCDLKFGSDYFEKLFLRFYEDEELGIASGIYFENKGEDWVSIQMPEYHAAGASKVIRAKCFRDINGFILYRGWDTADEIRALTMGWKTCHFKEIQFFHLKNEGSGMGSIRTNMMHGEIYYLTGGSKLFFLLKTIHRIFLGKPYIVGGLAMLYGFLKPLILKKKLIISKEESKFYKKLLSRRVLNKFKSKGT